MIGYSEDETECVNECDDPDRTLEEDLNLSDDSEADSANSGDSDLFPASKRIRLEQNPVSLDPDSLSSDEWDDNMAQMLDEQF